MLGGNDLTKINQDGASIEAEDCTQEKMDEILSCWLEFSGNGLSAHQIARKLALSGNRLISPKMVKENVEAAARWNMQSTKACAQSIREKSLVAQRRIENELERIETLLARNDFNGILHRTTKYKERNGKEGIETTDEVLEEVIQPTAAITALIGTYTKLLQAEAIASGVTAQTNLNEDSISELKIEIPGIEDMLFFNRNDAEILEAEFQVNENEK